MPKLDDIYKKAIDDANSLFFAGALGFGFFFVFLTASVNLPLAVQWPMQLMMMIGSGVSAVTLLVAPFLRRKSKQTDDDSQIALPSPDSSTSGTPINWPTYVDKVRRD
jgi:hypothetical protein